MLTILKFVDDGPCARLPQCGDLGFSLIESLHRIDSTASSSANLVRCSDCERLHCHLVLTAPQSLLDLIVNPAEPAKMATMRAAGHDPITTRKVPHKSGTDTYAGSARIEAAVAVASAHPLRSIQMTSAAGVLAWCSSASATKSPTGRGDH
jgi:hypothetical protein